MRMAVIVNPAAGTADDRAPVEELRARLTGAGHSAEWLETTGPGQARRLAASASTGCDAVIAAGGDGTLNEVVNGLADADALGRVAVAVLPIGTGNDFARSLGVEAPTAALDAIVSGATRAIDLAMLGDRAFLNASAGGFTAETSAHVNSALKQAVGRAAYLVGGVRAFLEHEPVPARVEADGRVIEDDLRLFAVCNGAWIGGGHQLAPTARPDDGVMEVCLVRARSALDFIALLPRLSVGTHVDDEDVAYFRARAVTCSFGRPIKVNTDGEVLEASQCAYTLRPGAVRFLCPAPGA
ncbi:diacylglycerol kinase [Luteitalea sp. TBR-22]|uniref:diacylglycerol/lipid kinase family protein n=1 Tax=Luteitalea sp. TBR-22 TaxID=2802971 RepID=UPI001AF5334E|nr:diacylglycerol kinase family protein [Luteitalea sp. TBR-22]BCS33760.1 diacylglycerol kinase [Luteitalea sp. TBR-22]